MRYFIDQSANGIPYCLACCECGWRQPATSHRAGLQRLAAHERAVHPKDFNVRKQLTSKPASVPGGTRRPKGINRNPRK